MLPPHERERLALLARFERLSAGLRDGNESTAEDVRRILLGVVAYGSIALLAEVIEGLTLVWSRE